MDLLSNFCSIKAYLICLMSRSVTFLCLESPPWQTKTLSWMTWASGIQRKTSAKKSGRNLSPGYFLLSSSSKPSLQFSTADSWLPRLMKT